MDELELPAPSSKGALQTQPFVSTKSITELFFYPLPPRKGMFDWAEMIQDAGWALWILQGHTISFALVVKASVNYTPAAFIFEIAGIKGWEGFLGCFIWMFSAGVHFNQGPIPPRPSAKHVADFPVVPLTFMRGILSWKSQRKPSVMVEESICVALINAITTRAR